MSDRFVVLGLAGTRATWFTAIGQWSHTGSIPVDFVKCVSAEQVRTRLASGRVHSAVLLDGALPSVDRDLIDVTHHAGAAVFVIDGDHDPSHWMHLGADNVLPGAFGPSELTDALRAHAAAVPNGEWRHAQSPDARATPASPLIALCGPGGTGVSTLAMALAQQLALDTKRVGRVVLADLRLRAEQAVLHDAGDVGPGIQELVDVCRTTTPSAEQTQTHTFAVTERGYALLLGMRQPTAWAALRPRAVTVAVRALQSAFDAVVCDCDSDLEGQAEGGSLDVEERNALARAAVLSADSVFVVGAAGVKGVYALARVINEIVDAGVAPARIVPVINRAGRSPRARSRLNAALAALLAEAPRNEMASAVFVPERDVENALHDRQRLPVAIGDPLVGAVRALRRSQSDAPTDMGVARRLEPGELSAWREEVSAP